MDNNQFGQAIKSKYPQYANIPNDALSQAVVKKYPVYQRLLDGSGSILPRSQTPTNGFDQAKLLNVYLQANPEGAQQLIGKLIQQRMGTDPDIQAFVNPEGQFSPTQQPGYQPYGSVDRGDLMKTMASQTEKRAALQERQSEAEANRKLRELQAETNKLLAQGRHEEALARVEQMRATLRQRAADAQAARKLKAQTENAKYPFQNLVRSALNKKPVISVPEDQDLSSMSDAELQKIANGK